MASPNMTTSLPAESGDFRRVLWTGLYSQLVLMTVPVGGDIGDEVRHNIVAVSTCFRSPPLKGPSVDRTAQRPPQSMSMVFVLD